MFRLSIEQQIEIARTLLPDLEDLGNGQCLGTCPGVDCHTTSSGRRDWKIWFTEGQGPHEHCVHKSCAAARDALMQQLYAALRAKDPAARAKDRDTSARWAEYRKAPTERPAPAEAYDPKLAAAVASYCPAGAVDDDWLRAHSPIRIPKDPHAWPALLLNSLYREGEHIIVFTKFASQGQLLHTPGESTVRLEEYPPAAGSITPVRPRSGFPLGAQNGVWFLCSPVTGEWLPNDNNRDRHGAKLGRRHAACCTRFPYLVLESDEAPPSVWLRILVQLQDPIVAVYTSGGKSYHALIRVDCNTKEEFDAARRAYIARLAALGADPAAISAVRLTRLPGCLRYGSGQGAEYKPYLDRDGNAAPRMQQLLYLNPNAEKGHPLYTSCEN